jgi:DNA-binding response OmpR family regulator
MTRRVLVVDDEPDIRLLVRFALEADGFDVTEVSSGEEALESISLDRPDVVLLDIKLPGMDGWQVVTQLRNSGDPIPVIMLSAHASDMTSSQAMEAGCRAYIAKPFSPTELSKQIQKTLSATDPGSLDATSTLRRRS